MSDPQVVHIHYHWPSVVPDARLDVVIGLLHKLVEVNKQMSDVLTDLKAAQSNVDSEMEQAITAMEAAGETMKTLAAKIASAGTDPSALRAITTDLNAQAGTLDTATKKLEAASAAQATATEALPATLPPAPPADGGLTPATGDSGELTPDAPPASKAI